MVTKYDKRLKYVVIVFAILALGNAIDFFFPSERNFKKVKGAITNADVKYFYGSTRSTRNVIYYKVGVQLDNKGKKYTVTERDDLDTALANLKKGDIVEFRIKKWYHTVFSLLLAGNLFVVRKNEVRVYDRMDLYRAQNKIFMFVFGSISLFFWVIFLDVVKGISLEAWFQRRVLKNRNYRR